MFDEQFQTSLPQLKIEMNLSEHQLKCKEACLMEFENLQKEIEDLHSIFHRLNDAVEIQGESVAVVVNNVEESHEQIVEGEKNLRRALTYKKAMYPLCGALLGLGIGGPVGLVAGLKVGGLAAVGCGVLGYTGGSAIKNKEKQDLEATTDLENKNE